MPTPLSRSIERILFRRALEKRLEGYTIETADEIALLVEPVTQPMFHIEGAESGRITSSKPNFTEVDREAVDANIRGTHPDFRGVQLDHLPEGSH